MKTNKVKDFIQKEKKQFLVFENSIQKRLHKIDKFAYFILILLIAIFRPDTFVISLYFILYSYVIINKEKKYKHYLYLSSIFAFIWVLFANKNYGYNNKMYIVFGLNSYPLFAFASGLLIMMFIYDYLLGKLKIKNTLGKFSFFIFMYWTFLLSAETIGYHIFNVRNIATAVYPGLPICDCLHAPPWMQISYFLIGPIYFVGCFILDNFLLKNKNQQIKFFKKKPNNKRNINKSNKNTI